VWGLNWPVMKFALSEWPPLSSRGWTGVVGALAVAPMRGTRRQPEGAARPVAAACLCPPRSTSRLWMFVMSLALLWLPASEAVVIAYTIRCGPRCWPGAARRAADIASGSLR